LSRVEVAAEVEVGCKSGTAWASPNFQLAPLNDSLALRKASKLLLYNFLMPSATLALFEVDHVTEKKTSERTDLCNLKQGTAIGTLSKKRFFVPGLETNAPSLES
jgi:hypothetical protein